MIIVTVNYRLNIFGYGDGEASTPKNLQLQDVAAGVRWVWNNIVRFGGDRSRITIGGESAGATLTHALLLTLPEDLKIHRALICSGGFFSSGTTPVSLMRKRLTKLVEAAREVGREKGASGVEAWTLKTAPVGTLLKAMARVPFAPTWQPQKGLDDHRDPMAAFGRLDGLMIGDCEFEGILWLQSARMLRDEEVEKIFAGSQATNEQHSLCTMYVDHARRSDHSSLGLTAHQKAILDFAGDYLFARGSQTIAKCLREDLGTKSEKQASHSPQIWQYIFDEANPFAASARLANPKAKVIARAHHAVDLLALWGNYDEVSDQAPWRAFREVGHQFRRAVVSLVTGNRTSDPAQANLWKNDQVMAFGPGGNATRLPLADDDHGTGIEDEQNVVRRDSYASRRRVAGLCAMRLAGDEVIDGVWREILLSLELGGITGTKQQIKL
jgi:carboxylesterase type B